MYMLERNEESRAYFELANAIMDAELGPQHERTLTVSDSKPNNIAYDLSLFVLYRPSATCSSPTEHI